MSLESHLESIRSSILEDINSKTDMIYSGLVADVPMNSIPESLFLNYFLPCFLGQGNNPNWVVEWISIAGTPMAEVAVFKDGTRDLLFIVPGILSTNSLFLSSRNGDMNDIFTRYEQLNNNLPVNGMGFLKQALTAKQTELMNNFNMEQVKNTWSLILQRYNLLPKNIENLSSSESSKLDDFFEL